MWGRRGRSTRKYCKRTEGLRPSGSNATPGNRIRVVSAPSFRRKNVTPSGERTSPRPAKERHPVRRKNVTPSGERTSPRPAKERHPVRRKNVTPSGERTSPRPAKERHPVRRKNVTPSGERTSPRPAKERHPVRRKNVTPYLIRGRNPVTEIVNHVSRSFTV